MTAEIRLPRLLTPVVSGGLRQQVEGSDLSEVLSSLFQVEPGLRQHLLDDQGRIRAHVLMFVDGERADLGTPVPGGGQVQVLQAVSGG